MDSSGPEFDAIIAKRPGQCTGSVIERGTVMHGPGHPVPAYCARMSHSSGKSLFEKLRSGRLLRALFALTALMACQSSFAGACESPSEAANSEIVAAQSTAEPLEGDCCATCSDCAYCGCCGVAAGPRVADNLGSRAPADAKTALATSARVIWTPPTLLRPPIRIA
jgi:hypothetical protein